MDRTIDELRRDGVAVAQTAGGYDLPVLDVTHPRFAMPDDAESFRALREALMRKERENRFIPKFLLRMMLRSATKKSLLVKAMFGTSAPFLDGMSTYVMKLGPDNLLPPYDAPGDRKFAAMPHVAFMRLRMQQVAELLADGLARNLAKADDRPLHLVNIGGGPGIDSLNALILTAHRSPDLLRRPVVIHVLDVDQTGAVFGRNALAQMKAEGGRLFGFDISFESLPYDWNDASRLQSLVETMVARNAVIVASSEGGLFEYGSDAAIVANLTALRAGGRGAGLAVGSVTKADKSRRRLMGANQFKLIPRGVEGLTPLAAEAGFTVGRARETIWSDQVELRAG